MLKVTYEAVTDLEPGRLARIDENRGRVRNLLDKAAPLRDVVRQLNVEIDRLMSSGTWYQLWDDEIVSRATPRTPLRIQYLLERRERHGVHVREHKGLVTVYIDPDLSVEEFAAVMNPATDELLNGGCWFQHYAGEIIDMTPESLSQV